MELIYDFTTTELKPGDLVILKSDTLSSQPMSVEDVQGHQVLCLWRSTYSDGAHRMEMRRECLQKVLSAREVARDAAIAAVKPGA
jgi:ActR/RegA family two-component response regulator